MVLMVMLKMAMLCPQTIDFYEFGFLESTILHHFVNFSIIWVLRCNLIIPAFPLVDIGYFK